MRVEKEPNKKRGRATTRSRTRSIPRDPEFYSCDNIEEIHSPNFIQLKNNIRAQAFAAGVTRIPLLTEIMKISANIIDMRWKEIHFIQEAIEMMKKQGIEESLVKDFELVAGVLEWEMDEKNVLESDLPKLGAETTRFVDISTWLILYFDLLHDNMHRIIDLNHSLKMLTKAQRTQLTKYEDKAATILEEFENNVVSFNLDGESARAYKKGVSEICKNCKVCL
uniref:Uncharacterized protein n=1 Tax=Panagrolaimus superbus TaxID=310955 RepID=A0A914YY81_9BILA